MVRATSCCLPQQGDERISARTFSSQSINTTTDFLSSNGKSSIRSTSIPESWENLANRLLNRAFYPVGFSNRRPTAEVAAWLYQVEEALKQSTASCVPRSFRLLDRVLEEQVPLQAISVDTLQWVLTCWKTSIINKKKDEADERTVSDDYLSPEEVWKRLSNYTAAEISGRNAMALSIVLSVFGQLEKPDAAPARAEALFQQHLQDIQNDLQSPDHPDVSTINNLLKLWLDSGLEDEAPAAVDRLLELLKTWHQSTELPQMQPDAHTYSTIIATYKAYADPIVAARRAESLLAEASSSLQLSQSFVLVSTVIDTVAKAGNMERAQALLKEQMERQAAIDTVSYEKDQPGAYPVASILEAYRNRIDKQPAVTVQQMETFLHEMENMVATNNKLACFRPNEVCYAIMIGAYVPLKNPQRAESVLDHVLKINDDRGAAEKMTLTSIWNGVLEAWVKSGHPETTQRVSKIVRHMEERAKNDEFCRPNVNTYNILLNCSATNHQGKYTENAQQAQHLLDQMQNGEIGIKPNSISFDTVMTAWCKANYPDNAEELLVRMCKDAVAASKDSKAQAVVKPTARNFTTVMNGWATIAKKHPGRQQPLQRIENLLKAMQDFHDSHGFDTKPTLIAYNIFLNCLSHSSDPQGPDRAESILRYIQEKAANDPILRPDTVMFNSVLTAWSRSLRQDAVSRSEALFKEMKSMDSVHNKILNSQSYTTLMSIYSKHERPDKAQALFDEMKESERFQPTFHSYIALLHAWANVGKPETAAFVLNQLLKEYEAGKFGRDVKPSIVVFNAVLNAWLKSKRPDAAEKAEDGLRSMYQLAASKRFDVQGPDLISFSTVIKAYSFSNHPDRTRRAMNLFEHMRNLYFQTGNPSVRPDLRIYVDLLHVLLLSEDPSVKTVYEGFDQMAGDPHHWQTQGVLVCSRLAYILDKSALEPSDKASLMARLHSMARQHSAKIDRTTTAIFDKYVN